ncbi:MAG: alpha/beta fold hydrolase [Bacteroidetes bacterium]|nr:MAG: alpha/beta fold hydrolase [Bacteroidota bacterium]
MRYVLVLHGNGGSRTRFLPALDILAQSYPDIKVIIPELSGFDKRPLPPSGDYWTLFLAEIERALPDTDAEWVLYGHGIGGSLLMELAARGYRFPGGRVLKPLRVILHSAIGASLDRRWFPWLMQPRWIRSLIRQAVAAPLLQPIWEKRLFPHPERIPPALRKQFFADYGHCEAFSVFFDLITDRWYRQILPRITQEPFYLLWGQKERVVAARYLPLWEQDFPRATLDIEPEWDHFPMMDDPGDFVRKFVLLVS